jgi:acyl transferase domain-containing protein
MLYRNYYTSPDPTRRIQMRPRAAMSASVIAALLSLFGIICAPPSPAEEKEVPRVFVHYSRSPEDARRVAAEVALYLASRGYEIADLRDVGFSVSKSRVRYFFVADTRRAEQVAAHLDDYLARATDADGRTSVQDYTWYKPQPRPGTIEVWIGSATAFRMGE